MKNIVLTILTCCFLINFASAQVENKLNNSSESDFSNCLCGGVVEEDFLEQHPEYGIWDVEVLNQILSNYGIENISCSDYANVIAPILAAYSKELFEKYPLEENPFDGQATDPCHTTKRLGAGNFSFQGTIEHLMIETDYVTNIDPVNGHAEYFIPQAGSNGGPGYVDIANLASCELYEIKPQGLLAQGQVEVANYLTKAVAFCPNTCNWVKGFDYPGTLNAPRVLPFPANNTKVISTWHAAPGVILYSVTSTTPLPDPVPVVLPSNILDRINKFIQKTISTGVDIDTAIRVFFDSLSPAERELLKQYALSAGIAIIVATLLEDILTAGFGVLDDPASFYLAYRLIVLAI